MSPLAIGILLFAGLALAAYTLFVHFDERSTVRASLRQIEGYDVITSIRERELLGSAKERIAGPAVDTLIRLGHRFTPQGYVEKTKKKLIISGKYDPVDHDRFLALRVITIAAIPVVLILFWTVLALHGKARLAAAVLTVLFLILGPDAILNRKVQERQEKIRLALPDILDLLTISVEAGLGFEQALDRTVSAVPGPLSDEFTRMLNEVRAGSTRAAAMRAIDERTDVLEVRSFILAILQADTFGVSIGRILRAQADEMRIKRRQLAQERAQKAPVKMLLPMVFCVFPALFVVVLGPAVINIVHSFSH
ncbi:MAG TPA: type II secretion system F family protein [Acidimicrobiales bacterium]|nr:type II secretion system F family protein [Acidimicrobiales bacterium]